MDASPIRTKVSAGGVAFRQQDGATNVVLISVGLSNRWQLPKGQMDGEETPELAAIREVREEGGVEVELIAPIEKIDYWFYAGHGEQRIRVHKYVHFFLMRYLSGDPSEHDHEVNEARWVEIGEAYRMLAFEGEKRVLEQALALIQSLAG
jgi:8-oxo-dGTP pyrophosphatase MutT (NUDIX family)